MPVCVDGDPHDVAPERNSALRIRIAPGKSHKFHRILTPAGIPETDEQMGQRVQEKVDAMRVELTEHADVREHAWACALARERSLLLNPGVYERVLIPFTSRCPPDAGVTRV